MAYVSFEYNYSVSAWKETTLVWKIEILVNFENTTQGDEHEAKLDSLKALNEQSSYYMPKIKCTCLSSYE